ncbi:LAFA_0F10748g1_1 [Lachancea sp. 'fantastica']|nr:LAFA_0F10748g1_1 [Lachancea sp. 'fantastica']
MDQEQLRKRMSQIELEIEEMNSVIDENLQLGKIEKLDEEELDNKVDDGKIDERKELRAKFLANCERGTRSSGDKEGQEAGSKKEEVTSKMADLSMIGDEFEGPKLSIKSGNGLEDENEKQKIFVDSKDMVNSEIEPQKLSMKSGNVVEDDFKVPASPSANDNNLQRPIPTGETKQIQESLPLDTTAKKLSAPNGFDEKPPTPAITNSGPLHESFEEQPETFTSPSNSPQPQLLPKTRKPTADPSATQPLNTPQQPRHTSNPSPFRVVSISKQTEHGQAQKLQTRHHYLSGKCTKLQREIQYLSDLRDRGALAPEDSRKISSALQKLQEYLDRKNKERYEVGVLLSRQLRREIDRGENGQFWVGN